MKVEGGGGAAAVAAGAKRRRGARRRAGGGFVVKARARGLVRAAATPAAPLRRLLAACRAAFGGPGTVPAPADDARIRRILDKMSPEDVRLSPELKFFEAMDAGADCQGPPIITQTTIYRCRNFNIAIFFMPASAVIPLHNHPGMTVFSKLLLGSLHIRSYDWVHPAVVLAGSTPDDRRLPVRLARLVVDADLSAASDTVVLYPEAGGNMHRLAAATPCAVLDVLGPPYSQNRDCTYYQDFPFEQYHHPVHACAGEATEEQKSRLGWLRETGTGMPKELQMYEVPYNGPPIF